MVPGLFGFNRKGCFIFFKASSKIGEQKNLIGNE